MGDEDTKVKDLPHLDASGRRKGNQGLRNQNPHYQPPSALAPTAELRAQRREVVGAYYRMGLRAYAIARRILDDPALRHLLINSRHPVNTVEGDIHWVRKHDAHHVDLSTADDAVVEYTAREDMVFRECLEKFKDVATVSEFDVLAERAQKAARNKAQVLGVRLDGPVIDHGGERGDGVPQIGTNINIFGSPEAWLQHIQAVKKLQEELSGNPKPNDPEPDNVVDALPVGSVPADERDSTEGA